MQKLQYKIFYKNYIIESSDPKEGLTFHAEVTLCAKAQRLLGGALPSGGVWLLGGDVG